MLGKSSTAWALQICCCFNRCLCMHASSSRATHIAIYILRKDDECSQKQGLACNKARLDYDAAQGQFGPRACYNRPEQNIDCTEVRLYTCSGHWPKADDVLLMYSHRLVTPTRSGTNGLRAEL